MGIPDPDLNRPVLKHPDEPYKFWMKVHDLPRERYLHVTPSTVEPSPETWFGLMQSWLDEAADKAKNSSLPEYAPAYLVFGKFTMEFMRSYPITLFGPSSFASLLWEKNRRYGPAPIRRWGHLGVVIRIDSKFQRATNLLRDHVLALSDETLSDTFNDILGYCCLGYFLLGGEV